MNRRNFRGSAARALNRGAVSQRGRYEGSNVSHAFSTNRSRGRSSSRPFPARNKYNSRSKKWVLCNLRSNGKEELETFILGVIYKLQDSTYNLENQHKIQVEDTNWVGVTKNLDHRMRDSSYTEAKIEFALITGKIEDAEKAILKNKLCGVRCIFAETLDDDSVDTVAEQIIDNSQEIEAENSVDEIRYPMRISKIRLFDDDTITDHELLFKLNSPPFFKSLNESLDRKNQFESLSDEELLILKLIAKACKVNATHYRESLMNLFNQFFASKLLKDTVTQDINAISLLVLAENKQNLQQKSHFYRRFLTYSLEIFVELLRTSPRKMLDNASTFLPMYNLLNSTTNSAFIENCGLLDEKMDKLKAAFITLFLEAKTKISNYTDEEVKARTASNVVRKEKPPPNNFRELGVFPSPEEILFETKPFLRKNLVDEAYNSVEHYLDVQFRLLREDYIAPLREGIAAYLKCGQGNKRKLDITIYDDVSVFPPVMDKKSGQMVSTISFTSKGMKRIRWEVSRKLLYGSLVCISSDKFRESLYFATVYDRKPEQLAEGKIGVVFELQTGQPVFNYRKSGYVMVESSAYFEAYRHVLQALLAIKDEKDMPFPNYFISCNNNIAPPKFLLKNGGLMNLDCLVQKEVCRKNRSIDILDASAWVSHAAFGLDESQYEAIKLALTRELAIIQGPPGTGKTFIGYSITKALLENENVWRTNDTPILVVCYTNHALDQFLEGITTFMKTGLIRIGGRSKNPNMEQYLLRNVDDHFGYDMSSDIRFQLNKLRSEKENLEAILVNLSNVTSLLGKSIINYDNLESVANKHLLLQIVRNNEKQPFSKNDLIRIWLTALKPFQLRRLPVDIDLLNYLMYETQFPQVACANALLAARGEYRQAIGILQFHRNNPELYRAGPQLIGLPPLEYLYDLMGRQYSFEDALFALQCNDCDLQKALNWLTSGFPAEILTEPKKVPDEPVDEIPFELMEQMRLDSAENQNRILDDDDGESLQIDDFVLKTARLNLQNNVELTQVDALTKDWSGVRTKVPLSEKLLKMILKSSPMSIEQARSITDAWALSINDRWRLYTFWVENFRELCETRMSAVHLKYAATVGRFNEIRTMKTMAIVKKARVVGMTTTGAAKHQAVLSAVKPKIAIIEEAAEVLESHIITSLSSSCEHLILIGDHFQLRPNPAVYQLAKHFNFDVSLFERLINNGFPHAVLTEQHRMRPEIADNLMPYFYANLHNHKSVEKYENVKGMSKNMYFFNHGHLEDQDGDSTTRKNVFEAKMIVGFLRYLQQQGYKPDQITILCCYAGQMFFIRRMINEKYRAFGTDKMVRISVVDDYQGEESDIILLSFVRSNIDGKIGFLKTKNRVCVALSRAKIGLFCIGNFDQLAACSKELWGDIVQNLRDKGYLGEALPLMCQIHNTETLIHKMEDFERLVPEGGCNRICEFRLNCGHSCTINCHTQNIDHTETKCTKDCPKKCPSGHPCKRPCHERCPPCVVLVERRPPHCSHIVRAKCHVPEDEVACNKPCETVLSCGHKCAANCHPIRHTEKCQSLVEKVLPCSHAVMVPCWRSTDENIDCEFKIEKVLPKCGHSQMVDCYKDPMLIVCRHACLAELKCGHLCNGNCNNCRNGRLHVPCNEDCSKILVCGHKCSTPCAADCPPCEKKCTMQCNHSKCSVSNNNNEKSIAGSSRKCGAPCPPCNEECSWKCPHFECSQKCNERCNRPRCNAPCENVTKCTKCKDKVKCLSLCGEICIHICPKCKEPQLKEIREIFFGMEEEPDARFIKLRDCGHIFEVSGFDAYVDNSLIETDEESESGSHTNGNKAIKFVECPNCKTPIFKTDRYRDVLKPKIEEIQEIKKKICGNFADRKDKLTRLKQKLKIIRSEMKEKVDHSDFGGNSRYSEFRNSQILDMIKIIYDYVEKLSEVVQRANVEESFLSKLVRWENFANYAEHLYTFLRKKENLEKKDDRSVIAPEITKFMQSFGRVPVVSTVSQFEVTLNGILHIELTKLIRIMDDCQKRASAQLLDELAGEIRRFGLLVKTFALIVELLLRGKHETPNSIDQRHKIFVDSLSILHGKEKITDEVVDTFMTNLKDLARVASYGLGVSNEERLQIIQAMNMRQGHWYKCPNGHFYCIADCGRAMETSICPECKAAIGGHSHQLLQSNSTATAEMFPEYANVPLQSLIQQGDEEMARRLQAEINAGVI